MSLRVYEDRHIAHPVVHYHCENCDGQFWIDPRERLPNICPFCNNRNMLGVIEE